MSDPSRLRITFLNVKLCFPHLHDSSLPGDWFYFFPTNKMEVQFNLLIRVKTAHLKTLYLPCVSNLETKEGKSFTVLCL